MRASAERPSTRRRVAAVAAIVLVTASVALTILNIRADFVRFAVNVALLLVAVAAAWLGLTRTGIRRRIAFGVAIVALVAFLAVRVFGDRVQALLAVVEVGALVLGIALARYALRRDARSLKARPTPGDPVRRAERPVLLVNPRSGERKSERVGLVDACHARRIDAVVLEEEADMHKLALEAVDAGADVIGIAGGDGSQAVVASVAAARDVPMVVVPAGTRNHLAADLGLDREDVVGALDAFGEAVERRIDLAEVNGRVFVNNVSLGLYATIVRSPEYREAKVDTTLSTLPKVLGPESEGFDLSFVGADGVRHERANLIQVSNNPYGRTPTTMTSRPGLDTHELGVITVEVADDRSVAAILAAVAAGDPERYEGFDAWSTPAFEVSSSSGVDAGIDGEAVTIEPPLSFSIRPGALRVRLPTQAIGASPAERALDVRSLGRDLCAVVVGRVR